MACDDHPSPAVSPSCSAGWQRGGAGQERLAATIRSLVLDGRVAVAEPASRRTGARGGARDQPRHRHRGVQPAARAGLPREQAGVGELGHAPRRPALGAGRDRRRTRARYADRGAAGAGGDRRAVRSPPCASFPAGSTTTAMTRSACRRCARRSPPLRSPRACPPAPSRSSSPTAPCRRSTCRSGRRSCAGRARPGRDPELPGRARRAARRRRSRSTPVPVEHDGWHLARSDRGAESTARRLSYLMPDFHNPSGRADRRSRPSAGDARAPSRAGASCVIDETFVELNLDGVEMPPPAAASATRARSRSDR